MVKKELSLTATLNKQVAYKGANFVVVATPTNYDPDSNYFDTSIVDNTVRDALELNPEALVVIKSTIPIGHTKSLQENLMKLINNKLFVLYNILQKNYLQT